jgi:hypothetical protein
MARDPISIPNTAVLNWHPIRVAGDDDNVPGPLWKLLTQDRQTGAITYMTHLPPGWRDDVLDWHPSTEESFRLSGGGTHGADPAGRYLYRQPGFLHGPAFAPPYESITIVQRMNRPLRILRYNGTKYPHVDGQAVTTEHENWPVDNIRVLTETLDWEEITSGGWAGTAVKWLHRHRVTGGGAILINMPPGWTGRGSRGNEVVEEFVVDGSVIAGGETYVRWGYVCRAAADPAGEYAAPEGATLICWWDADELALAN